MNSIREMIMFIYSDNGENSSERLFSENERSSDV